MKKLTQLFLSGCAVALLAGCSSGKDGEPGPAGPSLTGSLYGFVSPADEFGNPATKTGVTVTLDGVTPATTATTDANGRFEFANLRNGTYNLTFSRSDMSTNRRISVGHVGGDQPTFAFTTPLTQPSGTRILNPSATSSNGLVNIQFSLSNPNLPAGSFYRYLVYVGASASVTSTTGTWYGNTAYSTTSTNTSVTLTKAGLNALGLASGSTAYAVVYGAPGVLPNYTDPVSGRLIPTGLGAPSTALSFIVP